MNLVQYNEYQISIVATDGLVLQHQGISSYNAEYAPMCFQSFMGYPTVFKSIHYTDLLKIYS